MANAGGSFATAGGRIGDSETTPRPSPCRHSDLPPPPGSIKKHITATGPVNLLPAPLPDLPPGRAGPWRPATRPVFGRPDGSGNRSRPTRRRDPDTGPGQTPGRRSSISPSDKRDVPPLPIVHVFLATFDCKPGFPDGTRRERIFNYYQLPTIMSNQRSRTNGGC